MKHGWLVVLALASCKNDEADRAQEKFDRAVERAGGIERDKSGRAYKAATGTYADDRGGTVAPSDRQPRSGLPPPPPETDVTRGEVAEAEGRADEARALFDKACKAKVAGGCANALRLRHAKEPDTLVAELKKLCDGGDAAGCHALAFAYETVSLKPRHEAAEVIALYDKACSGGYADACQTLGMVYHSGRGGAPKDPDKAKAALARGCDLGDRRSCMQMNIVKRP